MMPSDPLADLPATAVVALAVGGQLASFSYSWEHPQDGLQDGLLMVGSADDGSLVAMWGDSWHQQPAPMFLTGHEEANATLALVGDYGDGWQWRIVFDLADREILRMRMENCVPADKITSEFPAGPYPVMVMNARRS